MTYNSRTLQLTLTSSNILSKTLRTPYYITNAQIHRDLKFLTAAEEIKKLATSHNKRLQSHTSLLITEITLNYISFNRQKRKSTMALLCDYEKNLGMVAPLGAFHTRLIKFLSFKCKYC